MTQEATSQCLWPQVLSAYHRPNPESPLFCLSSWSLGGLAPDFLGAPDTHRFPVSQAHLPPPSQEPSASCQVVCTDLGWPPATPTVAGRSLPPGLGGRGWRWPLFLWTVPDDGSSAPPPRPPQGSAAASSTNLGRPPAWPHTDTHTHTFPPAQGARSAKAQSRQAPFNGTGGRCWWFSCWCLSWEKSDPSP